MCSSFNMDRDLLNTDTLTLINWPNMKIVTPNGSIELLNSSFVYASIIQDHCLYNGKSVG